MVYSASHSWGAEINYQLIIFMASISGSFYRDANRVPITNNGLIVKKSVTFAGGTTDAIGDLDGALNPYTLFTVTGLVKARVYGLCTTNLAGATATVEVGIDGATAALIAQTTATDVDAGKIWINGTPAAYKSLVGATPADEIPIQILLNGQDIILTVGTANVTGGVIDFYCAWEPISDNGSVV